MRKKLVWLLTSIMMITGLVLWQSGMPVHADNEQEIIENLGAPLPLLNELSDENNVTVEAGVRPGLYGAAAPTEPLLGEPAADKMAPLVSYPIEVTGDASTDYYAYWSMSMWAATPEVVSFFDYQDRYNVAYMDGDLLKIQRYNAEMVLTDQISIPKSYSYFGNVTCDAEGNYYVVWAQDDTDAKNCITMSVKKYNYAGTFLAECAYTGCETWDDSFGTQRPFFCANCNVTVNNGVLAVNYGRNMYNGHQSNYILYVDCATMTKLSGAGAYTSHSFDQRIISLSDGGYLALNHGDAYPRGFKISRLDADRNHVGSLTNFHFREGGNRDHGYNETYAQMGGIVETDNAYVFCAGSERTLSVETALTNGEYGSHSEARDLFIQILKKDFYDYFGPDTYGVNGAIRVAMGTKPEAALTDLHLSGSEVDYGVLWLTDYEDTYYVANPKIVSVSDTQFAVMWEKRSYADHQNVETYYAVFDEDGNVIVQPLQMVGVRLAGNIDPVFKDGKIYWSTRDANGAYIHCLSPLEEAKDWIRVTGVQLNVSELDVYYGETAQIKATVLPANAYEQGVVYESSKPWVASVDENGMITGEWKGTTTITVTSKENKKFKATCIVNVKDYTISYELDGGNNHYGNPYLYNITTETIKLWEPSKSGYTFEGWYEDSEFTKEITEIPKGSTGHKILYAKWKQNLDLSGLFAVNDNCYFVWDAEDIRAYSTIDEKPIINEFKCDGTYTYYFQADGTAMRNRLTYHPDGVHVIYFDEYGHEVFSDFANVKKTIEGNAVDDYCFFDVNGYLYVDVVTYDKEGKNLYYANPFGVMDRGKWFEFSDSCKWADGTPFDKSGGRYGYANDDGTLLTNTWICDWEGRWCYLQGNGVAKY